MCVIPMAVNQQKGVERDVLSGKLICFQGDWRLE
jgi:hypothetical protein